MAVNLTKRPEPLITSGNQINTGKVESPIPVEFIDFESEPILQLIDVKKLPPFPAKEIPASRAQLFWDWKASLTEDDWNHLTMALYREVPYIDRKQVNPNANINIEIFASPWDHKGKTFLTTHGSGSYKMIINDSNRTIKGKGGMLGVARFVVNEPDYPPVFVLEELVVDHPSNRTLVAKLMAEGKLNPQGRIMTPQGGNNDNTALIALLTRMIEKNSSIPPKDSTAESISQMFVKANDTMLGMVKDQAKADDPDKLIKMLASLKDMLPKAESGNELLTLVVKMQSDLARVQAESQASNAKIQADSQNARESLMLKMMEMMNTRPNSEDAEDKVLSRIATYKELFGGEGKGKASIPELLIEHGAPVVLKVLETIQGFVNIKNYQDGLKKQQEAQVTVQASALPLPQAESTEPQPQTNGKVVEMPANEQQQLVTVIRGPAGPLILSALQRGEDGSNFANALEGMFGTLTYDQIASQGKDKILAAMQAVPEFWNQIVPASMEKFVEEFIAYGSEEGEEK